MSSRLIGCGLLAVIRYMSRVFILNVPVKISSIKALSTSHQLDMCPPSESASENALQVLRNEAPRVVSFVATNMPRS